MDDYALKQQLAGELKETLRIKELNLELMDSMESTILFLLKESKKTGVTLPDIHHLHSLLKRVKSLYSGLYDDSTNRNLTRRRSNRGFDSALIRYG